MTSPPWPTKTNPPFTNPPTWPFPTSSISEWEPDYRLRLLESAVIFLMTKASGSAGAYRSAVLASGPIAYWPLGDSPGSTTAAEIIAGRNGTCYNAVQFGMVDPWGTTIAASFDGISSYISIPYASALNPPMPFSIECWLNKSLQQNPAIAASIISNFVPFTDIGYNLLSSNAKYLQSDLGNDGVVQAGNPTVTNSWHHVVITFSSSMAIIYIDGQNAGQTANPNMKQNTTLALNIGQAAPGNSDHEWWPGFLSNIALYNRELSATEVLNHYNSSSGTSLSTEPPIGSVTLWPSDNNYPAGWLPLNGQVITNGVIQYPALATAHPSWVAGNGQDLNIPHEQDNFLAVAGGAYAPGQHGGQNIAYITTAHLPQVTAPVTLSGSLAHTHGGSASVESAPHNHSFPDTNILTDVAPGDGGSGLAAGNTVTGIVGLISGSENAQHQHTITVNSGGPALPSGSATFGQASPNGLSVTPFFVAMNFIVRAL